MEPLAAIYAGHQFGTFVPQLGDGRAILLGEVVNAAGEAWELQLKGSGLTAFSRFADGRAVLRSTIREYLCSEAIHALGIPTTRALAMTGGADPVYRETIETAAVLVRMAPTFVRFGSFELFASRGQTEHVKLLADYVIDRFFLDAGNGGDRYAHFLADVVARTARLMAAWQAVGFAHGVMNTDNFSIIGLTLDYGPFGFLDAYEPGFICNHSDAGGRYAFDAQPTIGLWNCRALAHALTSLVAADERDALLASYAGIYRDAYVERMRAKLGLLSAAAGDVSLVVDLLELLSGARADYTQFFRALCALDIESTAADDRAAEMFSERDGWYGWQARYRARLAAESTTPAARRSHKQAVNPKIRPAQPPRAGRNRACAGRRLQRDRTAARRAAAAVRRAAGKRIVRRSSARMGARYLGQLLVVIDPAAAGRRVIRLTVAQTRYNGCMVKWSFDTHDERAARATRHDFARHVRSRYWHRCRCDGR